MALVNCPDCNKEVSDKSVACINCGCPITPIENSIQASESLTTAPSPIIEPTSTNDSSSHYTPSNYEPQWHTTRASNYYPTNNYGYAPSQETYYQQELLKNEKAAKKAASASLTCGIIGLFFAGLILGIIAISQGNKAKRLGYVGKDASAGITLGIIAIVAWALIVYFWIL